MAISLRKGHSTREFPTVRNPSFLAFLLIGNIWTLAGSQAWAVLGGSVSSLSDDQAHLNASLRSTQRSGYTVHELRGGSGSVVREFSSPDGHIFAVAWVGPSLPDLQQILGPRFEAFRQAAQNQNRLGGHGPLVVQRNGMTVELGGHMRSYRGRAYLNDEIPSGVCLEEIR